MSEDPSDFAHAGNGPAMRANNYSHPKFKKWTF